MNQLFKSYQEGTLTLKNFTDYFQYRDYDLDIDNRTYNDDKYYEIIGDFIDESRISFIVYEININDIMEDRIFLILDRMKTQKMRINFCFRETDEVSIIREYISRFIPYNHLIYSIDFSYWNDSFEIHSLLDKFDQVKRLQIYYDGSSEDLVLPSELDKMFSLEELKISSDKARIVLPSLNNLTKLRKLRIIAPSIAPFEKNDHVESLFLMSDVIPQSIKEFSNLRKLYFRQELEPIEDQAVVEVIPETIGSLTKLSQITFDCHGLGEDFKRLLKVKSLTTLVLKRFDEIDFFPEELYTLPNLKTLRFKYCPVIGPLLNPEKLSHLREIIIYDQDMIDDRKFWESILKLPKLKRLDFHRAHFNKSDDFPNEIFELRNLESLSMTVPSNMKKLPDEIGQLTKLKRLKIKEGQIKHFPESFGNLINLETLEFTDGMYLGELPIEHMSEMTKLERVFVENYEGDLEDSLQLLKYEYLPNLEIQINEDY